MNDKDNAQPRGSVESDIEDALTQLDQAIAAHVQNPIFRDLALKAVELVRGVVKAHVSV